MKNKITILFSLFIYSTAIAQIQVLLESNRQQRGILENQNQTFEQSVMYPSIVINDRSLEKSLYYISATRQSISNFPDSWLIASIPDFDNNPANVKQLLDVQLENIKTMRSELYTTKAYINNGENVIDAIKTLKDKSELIINHIDRYAPWPTLNELSIPPTVITDIMPECCNYFYWYNSYLFLVGQTYKIPDPNSNYEIVLNFTDDSIYEEKFKKGDILINSFDNVREKLLYSREIIKMDINSLIILLKNYQTKMKDYANKLPNILSQNQSIYNQSTSVLDKYIKTERIEASEWIKKTNTVSAELRGSVHYYDSLITVHSREYYGSQQKIRDNELISSNLKNQVTQLTENSFEQLKALDSLRKITDRLLANCNEQDASDDCVKYPDSLKLVNKKIKLHFKKFKKINDEKSNLSDSILNLAEINDSLSLISDIAHKKFIEIREKYSPIATAYQQNQSNIKEEMIYHRDKYHLMSTLYNKLQIILGKKEDPLVLRLRSSLRLIRYKPRIGPLTPPDITDPDNPWNPGWIDPVRDDLLKELNIPNIEIDLNQVDILRNN